MIKNTHAVTLEYTLSAYSDNAAVVEGYEGHRASVPIRPPTLSQRAGRRQRVLHQGRDPQPSDRDLAVPGATTAPAARSATKARPAAAAARRRVAVGFRFRTCASRHAAAAVGRRPRSTRGWPPRSRSCSTHRSAPRRSTTNSAGPTRGYFRSFELREAGRPGPRATTSRSCWPAASATSTGPMVASGCQPGDAVIVLGGPAMLIGLGGGAASSMAAAPQRRPRFRQRAARQPGDGARAPGSDRPLLGLGATTRSVGIHDVGAGGLSNAIPELLHDPAVGGVIDPEGAERRSVAVADAAVVQRIAGTLRARASRRTGRRVRAICARERCPFAAVGTATAEERPWWRRRDRAGRKRPPIDLPMDVLFGKPPKMHRDAARMRPAVAGRGRRRHRPARAGPRVLAHPTVAAEVFPSPSATAASAAHRARDQMVGRGRCRWPTARSRCGFDGFTGEAMAIGERTPLVADRRRRRRAHGGRRGDHQPRSPRRSIARTGSSCPRTDGRRRPCRRGRAPVRRGEGGGHGTVPAARTQHPGRQGLAVDAGAVADGRRRTSRCRRCR